MLGDPGEKNYKERKYEPNREYFPVDEIGKAYLGMKKNEQ